MSNQTYPWESGLQRVSRMDSAGRAPELVAMLRAPEVEAAPVLVHRRARGGCSGCGAPVARSGALPVPVINGGALSPAQVERLPRSGAGDALASVAAASLDVGASVVALDRSVTCPCGCGRVLALDASGSLTLDGVPMGAASASPGVVPVSSAAVDGGGTPL